MRSPEESARAILRIFADLQCLRVGGTVTYQSLGSEFSVPEELDAGLQYGVKQGWLLYGANRGHTFTLTEAGYCAGNSALSFSYGGPPPSGDGLRGYRIYFLDETAKIMASEVFGASDHASATAMAVNLGDACRDSCAGVELWQGDRQIFRQMSFNGPPPVLNAQVEEAVVEREERILQSKATIARSKRLLERLAELKGRQVSAGSKPPI